MITVRRRIVMTPRNVLRVAALALLVLVGVGTTGGTAYAFWFASGSGAGSAAATVAKPLTTSAVAVSSGLLYPGATGDVRITINNPNPFPVTVTGVTGTGPITSDKGGACDAATGVTFADVTGASLAVPASGSASFTLAGAVAMDNSSDDTCQGATFTIPVALAGASA
jgi:hypothetical protein